jgi:tRNA dimethylallyltransferase
VAKTALVVIGETASGKSDLAFKIASQFNGEIVCADASTIRRGMDIGTAKASLLDRNKIPHHLLDIVEVDEPFSVAQFQKLAKEVILDIKKRQKLPIIVGGSGLYIDSLIYNYNFLPKNIANQSRSDLNKLDLDQLTQIISQRKLSLNGVDTKNRRRLIRLIETNGQTVHSNQLLADYLIIGLKIDKKQLELRLRKRLDKMFRAGLEEEVRQLSQTYGWQNQALEAIGYREWQDYLSGLISKEQLYEEIIKNSLHLAKKQRTWFKRNKDIIWFNHPVNWQDIVKLITTNIY